MRGRKLTLIAIFIFFSVRIFSQTSVAQAQAVFIYNFTRFIEWPKEYWTGDFKIGIYGSSELYDDLKSFTSGKIVGQQPISILKFSKLDDIADCHILFVAYGKTKDMDAIVSKLGSFKTLIITEKNGALETGSAINFVIADDKLKFELKIGNATKYGLKINSKLEEMAIAKY